MGIVTTCDERPFTGECDVCGASQTEDCGKLRQPRNIPCKWCSKMTNMLVTKQCDGCWELSTRIERDPELAQKILLTKVSRSGACAITGLIVHEPEQNRMCHADLYKFGLVWVIECAPWQYGEVPALHDKIGLIDSNTVFVKERSRGGSTIVVHRPDLKLNQAALDYMQDTWGSSGN